MTLNLAFQTLLLKGLRPRWRSPCKGVATPMQGVHGSPSTRRSDGEHLCVISENPIQKAMEHRDKRPGTVSCNRPECEVLESFNDEFRH